MESNLNVHLHSFVEFLFDGGDVHGVLDDLLVGGELFGVDGVDEGPGLVVPHQLGQQGLAEAQVLIDLEKTKL